jgi:hypothetical protein
MGDLMVDMDENATMYSDSPSSTLMFDLLAALSAHQIITHVLHFLAEWVHTDAYSVSTDRYLVNEVGQFFSQRRRLHISERRKIPGRGEYDPCTPHDSSPSF